MQQYLSYTYIAQCIYVNIRWIQEHSASHWERQVPNLEGIVVHKYKSENTGSVIIGVSTLSHTHSLSLSSASLALSLSIALTPSLTCIYTRAHTQARTHTHTHTCRWLDGRSGGVQTQPNAPSIDSMPEANEVGALRARRMHRCGSCGSSPRPAARRRERPARGFTAPWITYIPSPKVPPKRETGQHSGQAPAAAAETEERRRSCGCSEVATYQGSTTYAAGPLKTTSCCPERQSGAPAQQAGEMLRRRPWSLPPPPPPKGIWLEGPKPRHALRRWQARFSRVLASTVEGRRPPRVDFRPAHTSPVRKVNPQGGRVYDTVPGGRPQTAG